MSKIKRTVFVEFDFAILQGMKDFVGAANPVLAPLKVSVDEIGFARFFAGRSKVAGVTALLKHAGIKSEAAPLANEIAKKFREAIVARAAEGSEALVKLSDPLLAKGISLVLVTQADDGMLREALGEAIKEEMLVVSEPPQFADGYGWENWRRVCRRVDVHERLSVAVVGSGTSTQGAVAAGLYAAAIADPLAINQDFTGFDYFSEKLDGDLLPELMRVLWQNG
ncbi:MAG: hypothetical protein GX230_06370 [Lentisphaerae bacterium]|jgi:hypothetical protein|nr:hypothetical protein [Lentisphaerota bacterium]